MARHTAGDEETWGWCMGREQTHVLPTGRARGEPKRRGGQSRVREAGARVSWRLLSWLGCFPLAPVHSSFTKHQRDSLRD